MKRINVSLSDTDHALMLRLARFGRVSLGAWARGRLCNAALSEKRRLTENGELADFEQLEMFSEQKARGHK